MKQFASHLLLSILAIGLSVLSTCIAWGYMAEVASFWMSLAYGFVFIMSPVCVILLAIALFTKSSKKKERPEKKDETPKE